ncbi:hypothetical protein [Flavisphingomonas formosensis]|uniref:hypothetical protein n=1 Tax=Flavisphingomonas formosensis TaxID=861534 RepID=UPI0012FC40CB|nr:hypothetical protein [Sphingomonas formosensis]
MNETKLTDGRSLRDILDERPLESPENGRTEVRRLPVVPQQRILPPDDYFYPAGELIAMEYNITGCMGRGISGNAEIDPSLLTTSVLYTNVLTGEAITLRIDELPLGAKRVEVGCFYFISNPLLYYYCASIEDEAVTWHLIESFQMGKLLRCSLKQNILYSYHYIPVADKKILSRLRRRLEDYLRLCGKAQ